MAPQDASPSQVPPAMLTRRAAGVLELLQTEREPFPSVRLPIGVAEMLPRYDPTAPCPKCGAHEWEVRLQMANDHGIQHLVLVDYLAGRCLSCDYRLFRAPLDREVKA